MIHLLMVLMTTSNTVIVGLNGALQKRFILPPGIPLVPGDVHRARSVHWGVGGKGQDVAIALSCLKYEDFQLVQFIGRGGEGDAVERMLTDKIGTSAMQLTVRTASGMRTCTSVIADSETTEFVEPSGVIEQVEMEEVMSKLDRVGQAGAICFMGTFPSSCPEDIYSTIYSKLVGEKTICIIDSVSGLKPLFQTIAATKRRSHAMLKINASELCRLANVRKTTSEAGGVGKGELVEAIKCFVKIFEHARQALNAIAITDGAHPAYMATMPVFGEEEFRLFQQPIAIIKDERERSMSSWGQWSESQNSISDSLTTAPLVTTTKVYPIGAGDAVAAGTLAAWKSLTDSAKASVRLDPEVKKALQGNESPLVRAMLAAFAFGLACGTASCLHEENSVLKIHDVLEIYNREGRPIFVSSHKLSA